MEPIEPFLSGDKFSDDLSYRPPIISHPQARGDLLVQWVAGRRVLHVGFADHVPLIARRHAEGNWLHGNLCRSASSCHGIDIDAGAVAAARALGFRDVQTLDIFSEAAPRQLAACQADLVLVPDVIEHLSDPAAFLRRLAQCLPETEFVVTVPNGLSLRNAVYALSGIERINTDHRAWYSPFTLLKILASAGLRTQSLHACPVTMPGSLKGRLLHHVTQRHPIWSDVLLAQATSA